MTVAGFILAGGRSSRMGTDKAMLQLDGEPLIRHIAREMAEVAAPVTVVGPRDVLAVLGLPVLEDAHRGCGPLSGIVAALENTACDWSLVVACDMPNVGSTLFRRLVEEIVSDCDAVLPVGPSGHAEPLCALYHRRCLPVLAESLRQGLYKVKAALAPVRVRHPRIDGEGTLCNVNTPGDWQRILLDRGSEPAP